MKFMKCTAVMLQFSRDLETARFEPGAARSQSAALPQSYRASVYTYYIIFSTINLQAGDYSLINIEPTLGQLSSI